MAYGIVNKRLDESIHHAIHILQRYILSHLPVRVDFISSEQFDIGFNVYCQARRKSAPESSGRSRSGRAHSAVLYNLSMAQILSFVNETRRFLLYTIAKPEITAASASNEILFFDESLLNNANYKSVLRREYEELYAIWGAHLFYPREPHDFFPKSIESFGDPAYVYDFREMLVPVHCFMFGHELGHICMSNTPDDCAPITTASAALYEGLCNEFGLSSQPRNQSWIDEISADAIALAFCSNIDSREFFLPIHISNYAVYGAAIGMFLTLLNEVYRTKVEKAVSLPTETHPSFDFRLRALRLLHQSIGDKNGDLFDAVDAKLDKAGQALHEISQILKEAYE